MGTRISDDEIKEVVRDVNDRAVQPAKGALGDYERANGGIRWPVQHTLSYAVHVPAHPVSIGFVRKGIHAIGEICGDAVADVLALVLTELVTNAIRHGEIDTDEHIDVTLEVGRDGVRGAVRDPGVGFEIDPNGPTPHDGGGFGLYIVDRLARRWGVESSDNSTEVWFAL